VKFSATFGMSGGRTTKLYLHGHRTQT